ncbi:MAG: hypothetical protein ACFFDP_06575 [Promethearchaeota archaeon]
MATQNSSELLPVENPNWRIGFIMLSVFTVLLFIGEVVLLELARQAALQLDSVYLTIHLVNSYGPITLGTWAVGGWLSLCIIFGCTHPTKKPNYQRLVSFGFAVCLFLAYLWFQRTILYANLDYGTTPPTFPFDIAWIELPLNIVLNLFFSVFIASASWLVWYKWLRHLSHISAMKKTDSS